MLLVTEWSVSHEMKKTHRHKGCGWLASRRCSKYKKTHIVAKDVVGLLLGEVVSTKLITHHRKGCDWLTSRIYPSKNDSLTKMKTY
jgi:hypothetical protein